MAFHTMYGINGVGKDTIANQLRQRNPNLETITESRMLMYLLGITNSYKATDSVSREQYAQLEATPQQIVRQIETDGPLKELVGNISARPRPTLNLSHLVFAMHLNGAVEYLVKPKEDWFLDEVDSLTQIVAPSDVILSRRLGEIGLRQRVVDGVDEIDHHQMLCDKEWDRIYGKIGHQTTMKVIENTDLLTAVAEAEAVIYG